MSSAASTTVPTKDVATEVLSTTSLAPVAAQLASPETSTPLSATLLSGSSLAFAEAQSVPTSSLPSSAQLTVETPLQWHELQGCISQQALGSFSKLGRSAAQWDVYHQHRDKVLLTWHSMQNYVVWRVFGGPTTMTEGGKMMLAGLDATGLSASNAVEQTAVVSTQTSTPDINNTDASTQQRTNSHPSSTSIDSSSGIGHLPSVSTTSLAAAGTFGTSLAKEFEGMRVNFRPNPFPYNLSPEISHHNLWSSQPLAADQVGKLLEGYLPGRELLWWENPPVLQSLPGVWHAHVISKPAEAVDFEEASELH